MVNLDLRDQFPAVDVVVADAKLRELVVLRPAREFAEKIHDWIVADPPLMREFSEPDIVRLY